MAETDPATLAAADHAFVVAPAGCGKTELIARAVTIPSGSGLPHLILTHTNAGVAALRARLHRHGVPRSQARVETISGFALKYASAYPAVSGMAYTQPTGAQWGAVVEGALRVLSSGVSRHVLPNSYSGVYVDEYQDCNTDQHRLVLALAEALPVRLLGDPLQAIFDFKGQQLVDWDDIAKDFDRLPALTTPWRWRESNYELGKWLLAVRPQLIAGDVPDFTAAPLTYGSNAPAHQTSTCGRMRQLGSVVAIRQWAGDAHTAARNLGGLFTSMDEVEGNDLRRLVAAIDSSVDCDRALAVIAAATECITGVSKSLATAIKHLRNGDVPSAKAGAVNEDAVAALGRVASTSGRNEVAAAIEAIANLSACHVYRRELQSDLCRTARLGEREPEVPLVDLAWRLRDAGRRSGRRVESRVVSRTLLVKGLEFDHAVVLDVTDWTPFRKPSDPKNLYVAMSRPKLSLTVLGPM